MTASGAVPEALAIRVHLLCAGRGVLGGVEEEGVLRPPGELDLLAGLEQPVPAGVLREHLQLLAPGHPDEVLGADAEEAHVGHHTAWDGVARSVERLTYCADQHLLGPDTDPALVARSVRAVGGNRDVDPVHVDRDQVTGTALDGP